MATPPKQLAKLPAALRSRLIAGCEGDFRRLRFDPDGSVTLLNRAPEDMGAPPVLTKTPTKAPARTKARAPRRAREEPVEPAGPLRGDVAPGKDTRDNRDHLSPVRPEPAPVQMPRHLQDPPVRERRQAQQGPVLERRTVVTDIPIPPAFDVRDAWECLDVGRSAMAMLEASRRGLPRMLPLDMHTNVTELEGIQFDVVHSAVRNPQHVEIAGKDTKEKGYPVLRFTRGDMMVVVGCRQARLPSVIAAYLTSRESLGRGAGTTKGVGAGGTGGGGARKQQGLPGTPAAVMKRLQAYGVDFNYSELGDVTATVVFRGQELGKMKLEGSSRTQCESDYQRFLRKVDAITRRAG